MKKKLLALCTCVAVCVGVIGCSNVSNVSADDKDMFTVIESEYNYKVLYHNDSKVMYVMSDGSYNHGTFTLMVDADGKPLLWNGE